MIQPATRNGLGMSRRREEPIPGDSHSSQERGRDKNDDEQNGRAAPFDIWVERVRFPNVVLVNVLKNFSAMPVGTAPLLLLPLAPPLLLQHYFHCDHHDPQHCYYYHRCCYCD